MPQDENGNFYLPYGRLLRFESGLLRSSATLPAPYNIYNEDSVSWAQFPLEVVDRAVNWVFESGWMDIQSDEEYASWEEGYYKEYPRE